MLGPEVIGQLVIYLVVLLFAISAHEAAHAWMSYKFGDDTAYLLGRVTLNPAKHIDPIGTLAIPVFNFLMQVSGYGGLFLIGWGKPTPVNPLRWRNKDLANVMVSIAGILANSLIAVTFLLVLKALQYAGVFSPGAALADFRAPVVLFLVNTIFLNASLAIFNLLPIPPLDGGKILDSILPSSFAPTLRTIEQFGFIILMAMVYLGIFSAIFRPFAQFINFLIYL
jgi:Zn-dependent protease